MDYLESAKKILQAAAEDDALTEESATFMAQVSIASALIALIERLDKVIDDGTPAAVKTYNVFKDA